jgi:hypothetical protein
MYTHKVMMGALLQKVKHEAKQDEQHVFAGHQNIAEEASKTPRGATHLRSI